AAACQARAQGLTVVVLDEQPALGGQIYRRIESAPEAIQHILGADYVAGRALAREFKASGAIHITGAVVWNVAASGEINY
ncbi:NAD(P)-binding protein, partial [Streptomyces sp. Vc714c-19]